MDVGDVVGVEELDEEFEDGGFFFAEGYALGGFACWWEHVVENLTCAEEELFVD